MVGIDKTRLMQRIEIHATFRIIRGLLTAEPTNLIIIPSLEEIKSGVLIVSHEPPGKLNERGGNRNDERRVHAKIYAWDHIRNVGKGCTSQNNDEAAKGFKYVGLIKSELW